MNASYAFQLSQYLVIKQFILEALDEWGESSMHLNLAF